MEDESLLFTPYKLGNLTLRNRTIRSAAFESMCADNAPTRQLKDYHVSVAQGGVGMTTIAYASVSRNGLSFERQLWLRPEIVPALREITDAIHDHGAAASIQIGHCGNMTHIFTAGQIPISASTGFNIYSPTIYRRMRHSEITDMAKSYAQAVHNAHEAGFDAVEVHAGHGYLISQFLSPYTNHRRDEYGGSLNNRMRFMRMCMEQVMGAAAQHGMTVLVKTNMRDGFKGGIELDEGLEIARELQNMGVHALVLSGGFVSKAPMYVMRGAMPLRTLTHYMECWWLRWGVKLAGRYMIPPESFSEAYFLDDALRFRRELSVPLVYVGGLVARPVIDHVLNSGFELVQMGRALINEPDFVNRMKNEGKQRCACNHANYCIGRMYSIDMACHQRISDIPPRLLEELEKNICTQKRK